MPHYVVCNADESEPGTFKDRVLLESDPFAVIEAMTICGLATSSRYGFLYIRGEYPLGEARMRDAIVAARAAGLLGHDVMGSGEGFDIEIRRGGGAYICGEETALFNSIEGKRGEPRSKPPFPAEIGVFGKPTVANNVETLVNVLDILREGGAAWARIGTPDSAGPRLFCLSGHVERPGLYEVPFGATLQQLIDLAGGVPGGRQVQAVLLGGAAGSFVGPAQLSMPLTFEAARAAGTTLGSGVVMVFDETADIGDALTRMAAFFRHESCGQCVPVPRGHGAAGGVARGHAGVRRQWAGVHRGCRACRARGGDEGCVDLRPRPDGLDGDRIGAEAWPCSRGAPLMNPEPVWFRMPPPATIIPLRPVAAPVPMVALTIDGAAVEAPAGATILDACRAAGADIPTLCFLDTLTPVNACRVCVVEVEGARVLAPACSRKVEPGMSIRTRSPRVDLSRKLVLELLGSSVDLSTAPSLEPLMREYGADPSRFGAAPATVAQPTRIDNDLYVRDYSKCVLCYKCVEACGTDAQHTFAIAVAGRGFDAHISTEFDVVLPDSACVYCGNCIAVCPTGALMASHEYDLRKAGEWKPEEQSVTDTTCPYCGVGCTLTVHVQDQQIVKVTSPFESEVTHGNLCVKGRFGFEYVNK